MSTMFRRETTAESKGATRTATVALAGNPNAGKTSLFNAMTGLRAKTANYPGTTTELRLGRCKAGEIDVTLVDLPGTYALAASSDDERVAVDAVLGRSKDAPPPDAVIVLLDATHLERNLYLASELLELGLPVVVALNMHDIATKHGIRFDIEKMSAALGCPVVPTAARSGWGVDDLKRRLGALLGGEETVQAKVPLAFEDDTCPELLRYNWAEGVMRECVIQPQTATASRSEQIDRFLTNPWLGIPAFMAVMFGVFYLIFSLAALPMDLIDGAFGTLGAWVAGWLPEGDLQSLVVDGIIAGVGGVLIFLPQIVILFFLISLLEDTGYLARAAFVMDRLMRFFGLPGKAFVPMLSSHACAIPGIMAARTIEDRRDRLATILVLPLMTCSARLPVYAMITALLFPADPLKAAAVFAGAYILGILAAISMSLILKLTVLPGRSRPLVLELPSYKAPNLRNALLTTWDRASIFVKKAGTIILAISVVLWWLSAFPKLDPGELRPEAVTQVTALETQIETAEAAGDIAAAKELGTQLDRLWAREEVRHSFAGRAGRLIEPAIAPLGFDWQIGVGIVSAFAAREVVVSTLGIVYGVGEEVVDEPEPLLNRIREARGPDGELTFDTATSVSLLVFFVLAMLCLPTQAVTKRETNSWKWAIFQLGYMTALAYVASLVTYQVLIAVGA